MKRKRNSWVNRRKIVGRKTRSSSSTYVGVTLPIDLIMEILLRLPAKSIQVFGFASKQSSSLIRSPYFTDLFYTKSLSRPRFLFTFIIGSKWHLFSSPQLRNFGEKSVVATKYHMSNSEGFYKQISQYVNGFIYLKRFDGKIDTVHEICNPCTGQRITLPKVDENNSDFTSFFGYDPIGKQFKVLCWIRTISYNHYQVLTLGTKELSWRKIECSFPHCPHGAINGICINGILYYIAWRGIKKYEVYITVLVCFDIRSENFSFQKIENDCPQLTLINFKGKLGIVSRLSYGSSLFVEILVLDDTKKVKWLKHKILLRNSPLQAIKSLWATDMGEIVVLSGFYKTHPLYVFYYNLEKQDDFRRVEIKGIEDKLLMEQDHQSFFTFTNHVENMMFL